MATIHTYTIVRTPPRGHEGAPYCVAIVDDGGIFSTQRITGFTDGTEVNIGDSVHRLEEPDEFGAVYHLG